MTWTLTQTNTTVTGPIEGLREGARGATGSRRAHRTRNALVVVEVVTSGAT